VPAQHFLTPCIPKWFDEYHKKNANIAINYQSIGSGGGIKQVTEGTVDFGASDVTMNDETAQGLSDKHGTGILHFPTVLGAVVPPTNIAGVDASLNFTPEALAGIFLGKITKWNDPAIADANKGAKLPAEDIVVVHRAEASGTTFIWTDYLSKVSEEWKNTVGAGPAPKWPVGLGGEGQRRRHRHHQEHSQFIGYVELIYAESNKIPYGSVKNAFRRVL